MKTEKTGLAALSQEQRYDVRRRIGARLHECERSRCGAVIATDEVMIALDEGGYVVARAVEVAESGAWSPGDLVLEGRTIEDVAHGKGVRVVVFMREPGDNNGRSTQAFERFVTARDIPNRRPITAAERERLGQAIAYELAMVVNRARKEAQQALDLFKRAAEVIGEGEARRLSGLHHVTRDAA